MVKMQWNPPAYNKMDSTPGCPIVFFGMSIFVTFKCLAKFVADDILSFCYFSKKISLDISGESSAWQMIHMKCQDLFSMKNTFYFVLKGWGLTSAVSNTHPFPGWMTISTRVLPPSYTVAVSPLGLTTPMKLGNQAGNQLTPVKYRLPLVGSNANLLGVEK